MPTTVAAPLKTDKKFFAMFECFRRTVDSSVSFLERALTIIAAQGRVGMLTPNKWFRAAYAEGLRALLRDRARISLLVDFGHSRNLFPAADTFPAAVVFASVPVRWTTRSRVVLSKLTTRIARNSDYTNCCRHAMFWSPTRICGLIAGSSRARQ